MSVSIYQNGALTPVAGELYKDDPAYLLDFVHPKGTYFWTDDQTFDPNTEWGGTWERIEDSFIYAIKSTENADGVVKGSKEGSFTIGYDNLPPHQHYYSNSHSHGENFSSDYGETQKFVMAGRYSGSVRGGSAAANPPEDGRRQVYTDSASVSGRTYYTTSYNDTKPPMNTPVTFDKMPPYIGAYCWHRTA